MSAKATAVVASPLAGGSCIEDTGAPPRGITEVVRHSQVMEPSGIGTFRRSFRPDIARRLDAVLKNLLRRSGDAGAGPDTEKVTDALDFSVLEAFGLQRRGARRLRVHPRPRLPSALRHDHRGAVTGHP